MEKKDVLIVYATVHGQAELIARRIAEAASEWNVGATVQDVRSTKAGDLAQHGSIIVVASVHYGRHARSITRFVQAARAQLSRVPTAFLSVSGDAAEASTWPRAEQYVRDFFRITGWMATEWMIAGGAVKFTKYNFVLRWIMRRASARKGLDPHRDHDFTDWAAVLQFAKAFLAKPDVRVA